MLKVEILKVIVHISKRIVLISKVVGSNTRIVFKNAKISSLLFIAIITLCGFFNLINIEKPTMSKLENRELQKLPSFSLGALFNGSFTRDFENYYSDTFLFRENLVLTAHDIREGLSLAGESDILMAYSEGANVAEEEEAMKEAEAFISDSGAATAAISSASENTAVVQEGTRSSEPAVSHDKKPVSDMKDLGFWLSVDSSMKKIFGFGKNRLNDYARILNLYGEKMGEGVTVYSLIPPDTGQYLAMKKYAGSTESKNDMTDYLNGLFNKNVKAIDVYGAINKHKDEYVYFRSDHHWTMRGAYYGYTALMNFKGSPPVPIEKYEIKKVENSLGSIYRNTLSSSLKNNPDTVELFLPFVKHEFNVYDGMESRKEDVLDMKYVTWQDKYPIFLSTGGGEYSVIKTDVGNGKKVLVIKTSFGNPFSPLLMADYEEVYTVDVRFYRKGGVGKNIVKFVKDNGIQDVIFVIYDGDVYSKIIMPAAEKLLY